MSCSILILTLNEDINIRNCLLSLSWCDDIVVLDSFSDDNTKNIVSEFENVRFVEREFDGYASQRNFGLKAINYKYQWLFMVDADEIVTKDLSSEIFNRLNSDVEGYSIYRMRRKDFFYDKWIKHSSGYPTWFGRLLRIDNVTIEREINEEYLTSGKIGYLDSHLNHYPFNKGIEWWFSRHNRYSSMEAKEKVKQLGTNSNLTELFDRDPVIRRRFIKNTMYRLPFRPLIMFFILYFLRGGILDGMSGFRFSLMRSIYEYMIDLKVLELKNKVNNEESKL